MFTCLSEGFDGSSFVFCVTVSCWRAQGREAGCFIFFLIPRKRSGLVDLLDLVTHSVGDSFHRSLHRSASPIFLPLFCSWFNFSAFASSLTTRKSHLLCALSRGLSSRRWWHTTSIFSSPFVSTTCQVINAQNRKMESVQMAFEAFWTFS